MHIISVTCSNASEAQKIASSLLTKRLVVCANYFPVASQFLWHGKARRSKETMLLLKTGAKHIKKAVWTITKLHSYDCPVIEIIKVRANAAAEAWLRNELS